MPDQMTIETVRDAATVQHVVQLADEIWNEHYPAIIGQAQVDYMVPRFQSAAAIQEQIRNGDDYFLLHWRGQLAGYLAVNGKTSTQRLFISKLYVLKALRGQGLARQALAWLAETYAQPVFWLNVNKYNPAVQAYQRLGFVIANTMITDIGNGYVMDDYMLEWRRPG